MTPLTRRVLRYQATRAGMAELTHEITRIAYRFPSGKGGFTDEDAAEFILQFAPRIPGLVTRYRDTGRSFESYLCTTLKWQLKSFASNRASERIRYTALCGPGGDLQTEAERRLSECAALTLEACEECPGHAGFRGPTQRARQGSAAAPDATRPDATRPDATRPDATRPASTRPASAGPASTTSAAHCLPQAAAPGEGQSPVLTAGQRRRMLHMALKMSEMFDEADYRRVADATGYELAWILDCWQQLRGCCEEQRERRRALRERRDRAWFRIRCIQYRMRLTLDEEEREAALRRLAMWRRRYEHARRVLDRMHYGPTHADIARVIGVPKGTVDSSIFYGKRELRDPAFATMLASAVGKP